MALVSKNRLEQTKEQQCIICKLHRAHLNPANTLEAFEQFSMDAVLKTQKSARSRTTKTARSKS